MSAPETSVPVSTESVAATPVAATPVVANTVEVAPPSVQATVPVMGAPRQRLAALYVGDLAPSVTESDLYNLFKAVGNVQSIRVCRDSSSGASLRYAYVNLVSTTEAEKAIELLNCVPVKGKPIRISWSNRDPSKRRSPAGNIFVKDIPSDIDSLALEDLFGPFGNTLSCKAATDDFGNPRGFGFVHFEKPEDAKAAIESMNGKFVNNQKIFVGPFIPKSERENRAVRYTNLFAKEMAEGITQEAFTAIFTPYGEVTSVCLRESNGKPFGFCNFAKHEDAVKALEELNQKEIEGKKLYVARAQNKAERQQSIKKHREEVAARTKDCNLYVRNLPNNCTAEKLTEVFKKFGTITSLCLAKDAAGAFRGFGFVCFSCKEEAVKALQSQEKMENKPLFIAIHQRKEERRAFLETQHARRAMPVRQYAAHPSSYPPHSNPYSATPWNKENAFYQQQPQFYANPGPPQPHGKPQYSLVDAIRNQLLPTYGENAAPLANKILDKNGPEVSQKLLQNKEELFAKAAEIAKEN